MKWSSGISALLDPVEAVGEVVASLRQGLEGVEPNLILLFVSEHHRNDYREIAVLVGSEFGAGLLLGCSARSVLGDGREIEHGPSLAMTAAVLPGVTLRPFHYEREAVPELSVSANVWRERLGDSKTDPHILLLSDPYSFDVEPFARGLDLAFPSTNRVGGVASGGAAPGDNVLLVGSEVHNTGVVGVALSGDLEMDSLVAQGCRPIGVPMFVTGAHDNVIDTLDGRPALEVLEALYESLGPGDRELSRGSLFLGLQMRGEQSSYEQGDFLIRNLVGSDPSSGALLVGGVPGDRQVVQFHLRDAETSAEDLDLCLTRYARDAPGPVVGALLFSCLGRGAGLYGEADHDSRLLREHLGKVPVGGFFCNGEIGPVQGRTFLHGYTSALALFRSRSGARS